MKNTFKIGKLEKGIYKTFQKLFLIQRNQEMLINKTEDKINSIEKQIKKCSSRKQNIKLLLLTKKIKLLLMTKK